MQGSYHVDPSDGERRKEKPRGPPGLEHAIIR